MVTSNPTSHISTPPTSPLPNPTVPNRTLDAILMPPPSFKRTTKPPTPPSDISPSHPTTPLKYGNAIRYVGSEEAAVTKPGIISHKPSCPVIFDNATVPKHLRHVLKLDKYDERLNDGRPILPSPEQRKWEYYAEIWDMNKSNTKPSWYEEGCGQVIKGKGKEKRERTTSDHIAAYAEMEFDFYLTLATHPTSTTEENTIYTSSSSTTTTTTVVINPNPNSITPPAPPSQRPVLPYIHPRKVQLPLRITPQLCNHVNATSCHACIIYSIAHTRAHDTTELQHHNAKHANAVCRDGGLMVHLKRRVEMNLVKYEASESGFWGRSVEDVRMKRGLVGRSATAYVPANAGGASTIASGMGKGKGKGVGKKEGKGKGPALVVVTSGLLDEYEEAFRRWDEMMK